MSFTTIYYPIFLSVFFVIYWSIKDKYRCLLIILASYGFYMFGCWQYGGLLVAFTIITWSAGRLIAKTQSAIVKKILLAFTLFFCFGILFIFKYYNFFGVVANKCIGLEFFRPLNLLLPIGISFFTFQTVGYVIDIYWRRRNTCSFSTYVAYVAFFPQLVAGPIERADRLIPQFQKKHYFNLQKSTEGMRRILWGYFKKLVVANNLAIYVDSVYDNVENYHGITLVIAALFFSVQIYCDFSGYSDIAIGTAKLLNIDLTENFYRPYKTKTIKDFWRCWHISLTSWLRDYIYIPLGGSQKGKKRTVFNTLLVFLISGIWHGANWTFLLWGLFHGLILVIEQEIFVKCKYKIKVLSGLMNFMIVTLLWIFFRAQSIKDAIYVFTHMFEGITQMRTYVQGFTGIITLLDLLKIVLILGIYYCSGVYLDNCNIKKMENCNVFFKWGLYIILSLAILILSPLETGTEFIYFQF